MIIGIGIDFMKMSSITDESLQAGDPFREKMFTANEQEQAEIRSIPGDYFRTRFAAKEAVFKTLRVDPDHVRLNEIEILDDENGAPHVTLYGALKKCADEKKIQTIHISITYDDGYVQAFAVSEG